MLTTMSDLMGSGGKCVIPSGSKVRVSHITGIFYCIVCDEHPGYNVGSEDLMREILGEKQYFLLMLKGDV